MSRINVKQILPDAFTALTDGAAVTFDCNNQTSKNNFLSSAQTAIAITLSNFVDGSRYTVEIKKQSASPLVLTFPAAAANGTVFTFTGAANTFYKIVVYAFTDTTLKYFVETVSVDANGNIYGLKNEEQIYIEGPTNKTYPVISKKTYPETLNNIKGIKTTSGTCTVAFQINGTNVTGLSAISVTSTAQDVAASALNSMVAGDRLTLVITSAAAPVDLEATLEFTR